MAAPHDVKRPGRGDNPRTGPEQLDAAGGSRLDPIVPATTNEIRRRRDWARRMIRAADGPIPRYGSAAWHRLPETDRKRIASVVLASECWAEQCDETPRRLAREIADGRAELEAAEAREFAAMAAGVRRLALVPLYAELADRRGEPERAARSRARSDAIRDGWNRAGGGDAA